MKRKIKLRTKLMVWECSLSDGNKKFITKIFSREEAGLWFELTEPAFRSRVPSPSSGSKLGVGWETEVTAT